MSGDSSAGDKKVSAERGGWRLLLSGVTVSTLLTAILILQGRAYRSGYMHALGLDEGLFPVSTADTFWLAFNGWLSGAVRVADVAWDTFKSELLRTGLWTSAVIFLVACIVFSLPRESSARRRARRRWWGARLRRCVFTSLPKRIAAIAAGAMATTVLSIAIVPLALFLGALVLMFLFLILVYPFVSLGAQAANDFCRKPVSTASVVTLIDEPASAYLIECNAQLCALLDAKGNRFIVPADQIARIDIRNTITAIPSDADRCLLPQSSEN